jgi:orotidine-5'-phosphate decarboxylase
MPRSFFLVPGYGAQGGTADDAAHCFNPDKLGAVVNASRSVTYAFESPEISESEYGQLARSKTKAMIEDIANAARRRFGT